MDLENQFSAFGIDHGFALAPVDFLGGVPRVGPKARPRAPRGPPASVVLTLWLSITAALGLTSRPTSSRSSITK
jgi:hypothetical protein